jgi:hypothetical protein
MTEEPEELHETSEDELEKELVLIENLIKNAPDENQAVAAYRICMAAIIWGSRNEFEVVGILEEVRRNYFGCECEGCDGCDEEEGN